MWVLNLKTMSEDIRKMINKVKNVKQFVNESVESLEDKLKNKLLSLGGHDVKLGLDSNEEQNRMLNDGRIFNEKVNFNSGIQNQCHRNVSDKFQKSARIKDDFKIISGYALTNDIWIQHSWGFNRNGVIETTTRFDLYYGYELTPEESEEFCYENE
jgi:hypothetical protein